MYWDLPFQLGVADYDPKAGEAASEEDEWNYDKLRNMFQVFVATNERSSFKIVLCVHWRQTAMVARAAEEACQITDIQMVYAYKNRQNATGCNIFINAVEVFMILFKGKRADDNGLSFSSPNPVHRHNLIFVPYTDIKLKELSKKINPHQKSAILTEQIFKRCLLSEGTVFIAGAGAGGDVFGAVRAGARRVVAVENDIVQWKRLGEELTKHAANSVTIKKQRATQNHSVAVLKTFVNDNYRIHDTQTFLNCFRKLVVDSKAKGLSECIEQMQKFLPLMTENDVERRCCQCAQSDSSVSVQCQLCSCAYSHPACAVTCRACDLLFCSKKCKTDHACDGQASDSKVESAPIPTSSSSSASPVKKRKNKDKKATSPLKKKQKVPEKEAENKEKKG
jgi:hypothetical protein